MKKTICSMLLVAVLLSSFPLSALATTISETEPAENVEELETESVETVEVLETETVEESETELVETVQEPETEQVKTVEEPETQPEKAMPETAAETEPASTDELRSVYEGECGENATWHYDDETYVLTISGTGPIENFGSASAVPWYSYRTKITTVEIESGITGIGDHAFEGCRGLNSFTIPAGVTEIGLSAFYGCATLTKFAVESGNTAFSTTGDVLFNADQTILIAYPAGKTTSKYTIPSSVNVINDYAFGSTNSLTNLTILSGVTEIKSNAFKNCARLTGLTIPASVTSIGADAFYSCNKLAAIYFKGNAPSFGDSAFNYTTVTAHYLPLGSWTSDVLQDYDGTVTWVCDNQCGTDATWSMDTDGVLSVSGTGAMADYQSEASVPWYGIRTTISSIVINNGITRVGNYAFIYASNVASVTLPDSVTSIGEKAFSHLETITGIGLSAKLTSIEAEAFSSCVNLSSITFPKTVTEIGEKAFDSCRALETISFEGRAPLIGNNAFNDVTATAYYLADSSWTAAVRQNYGKGIITWEVIRPTINKTDTTIPVFQTEKLTMSGPYSSYVWSSSDTNVATVDSSGLVTAHKYGTAYIMAEVSGTDVNDTCMVQTLFWDVADSSKYYFRHVYWAAEAGITNGYNLERFEPQTECSREQMMTFLWRMAGKPEPKTTNNPFPDVENKYYYKAVLWGVENGITNGYSSGPNAGKFGVGLPCTREQAMTFLWRMADKPNPETATNPFSDVKSNDYFYKAVLWASENGIAKGYNDGTYGVGLNCLREHMVTFLSRYNSKYGLL